MDQKPKPWILLETAFYRALDNGRPYDFLANGIQACLENATSLAREFSCLATHVFNARAQFVMATAMEEMGKALILLDLARIPWHRKDWIKSLCRAFYHHVKKGAYAKTIYWPGAGSLTDALILFKAELIEYWPNRDPESGEPDQYAAAIVEREWGLYVDWDDFGGRWFSPESSSLAQYYAQELEQGGKRVGEERIEAVLSPLAKANAERLFTADALKVIHAVMSQLDTLTETPESTVISALESISRTLLENGIDISEDTIHSNFMCYPLYPVIVTPEKIKGYWEQ